jgi:CBS domain containing-hemolysin-like protein
MPNEELSSASEPPGNRSVAIAVERHNLPIPMPRPSEVAREDGESWLGRVLRAVFGWKPGSIRADLEVVLEGGALGETGFSPEESTMLKNILGLRERRIEDVMVPRADIVAVQQDISLGELVKVFEGAGHSRLVVYSDTLDGPVGMVHIRDLIAFMTARAQVAAEVNAEREQPFAAGLDLTAIDLSMPLSATKIVRQILFVPPSMPAMDLLAKMQATRIHLALVIDEYGGTDGIVSIEDIVEEVVGDIADEHDEAESPTVVPQTDGSFLADGRASLEDVMLIVGPEFDVGDLVNNVDTLSGYLVTKVGRVPVRGELVPGPAAFEIAVLDADPRRIKKVKIYRSKIRRPSRAREPRRREGEPETPATGFNLPVAVEQTSSRDERADAAAETSPSESAHQS